MKILPKFSATKNSAAPVNKNTVYTLPSNITKAYIRSNELFPRRSGLVTLYLSSQLYLAGFSWQDYLNHDHHKMLADVVTATNKFHSKYGVRIRFASENRFLPAVADTGGQPLIYLEVSRLELIVTKVQKDSYNFIRDFVLASENQLGFDEISNLYLLRENRGENSNFHNEIWESILFLPSQQGHRFWTLIFTTLSSKPVRDLSEEFKKNQGDDSFFSAQVFNYLNQPIR